MDRRSFFKSLKTKAAKVVSSNCYEINLTNSKANIFNKNKEPIILIDSNIANFKNTDAINFCYFDFNSIDFNELILKIRDIFPNQQIIGLSSFKIKDKLDSIILLNQEEPILEYNNFILFAYDYNYLNIAEELYLKQIITNKDIFVSQLLEENLLTDVFINRIKGINNV